MRFCIYGSASDEIRADFLAAGEALGEEIARRGHGLVFGGGGRGLMGATARGASRIPSAEIIGVAPTFFPDGAFSPHCTAFHSTETMRERKQLMEDLSDAFIVTPGGIGTLEEFFEIFTLRHLGRIQKRIAVLNTDGFYDSLLALLCHMEREAFLPAGDLALLFVSDDPVAILDHLEETP